MLYKLFYPRHFSYSAADSTYSKVYLFQRSSGFAKLIFMKLEWSDNHKRLNSMLSIINAKDSASCDLPHAVCFSHLYLIDVAVCPAPEAFSDNTKQSKKIKVDFDILE
jgi:hypothetical protein